MSGGLGSRPQRSAHLIPEFVGKRFGRLQVRGTRILRKANGHTKTFLLCQCDCGEARLESPTHLRNGEITSCGCWGREKARQRATKSNDGYPVEHTTLWNTYVKAARKRGFLFALTRAEFTTLLQCLCVYCGAPPSRVVRRKVPSDFRYNGIDRIDNSVGYEMSNVVSCCLTCNRAKHTMTLEEWEIWLDRICHYREQNRKGVE